MTDKSPPALQKFFPICFASSLLLYAYLLLFLVFGVLYLGAPDAVVGAVSSLGKSLGIDTVPSSGSPGIFDGWLIFTFAYMMGAAAASFLAATAPYDPLPYLRILTVLKVTSSMTGLALFLFVDPFAFYLATALVDGVIAVTIFMLFTHLRGHMEGLSRSKYAPEENESE